VATRDSAHTRSHAQKFFRKLVKVINAKLKQEAEEELMAAMQK